MVITIIKSVIFCSPRSPPEKEAALPPPAAAEAEAEGAAADLRGRDRPEGVQGAHPEQAGHPHSHRLRGLPALRQVGASAAGDDARDRGPGPGVGLRGSRLLHGRPGLLPAQLGALGTILEGVESLGR